MSIFQSLDSFDNERRELVSEFIRSKLYPHIKDDLITYFLFIYNATREDPSRYRRMDKALYGLKSLSIKPLRSWSSPLAGSTFKYPSYFDVLLNRVDPKDYVIDPHLRAFSRYFAWQKSPYDAGKKSTKNNGLQEATGLGTVICYWMGRYFGFIPQ